VHVCSECGQGYERAGYCAADGHPLADATDPLLGTEVLRYRLARLIGRGGMGSVYLGVQPEIGSRVAIKILSQECALEPDLVDRFFGEARAVNLIRHENIVSVLDMAKLPDGRPFIIMEFIEGVTLSKVIKGGRAPLGGIVQVFSDVLSALDAAHAIGIVHRDLKPDNILITSKGHARVLDFGIAKLSPTLRANAAPRTETGALLGTPAYMAPEQIGGAENVDGRSDVYGAGVVLFEAVTGRVPFGGATLFDMMRAQLEDEPPSPRSLRADLPVAMEAVILTALAKKPELRFQSAAAMANALERASAELPHEQWRELSGRSAPLTRGSAPRVRAITTAPPPMTMHRDTPPAISAINLPRTEEQTTAQRPSKRPIVIAVLGMAVAGGVGAIIAIAAGRTESPTHVVAAPTRRAAVTAPGSGSSTRALPAQSPAAAAPAGSAPAAAAPAGAPTEQPEAPAAQKIAITATDSRVKPTRQREVPAVERSVNIAPTGGAAPVAPAAPPSVAPTPPAPAQPLTAREQIAKDFNVHPQYLAVPGEVPVKQRPRMSRGNYNAMSFDFKAFLPQATARARAEAADAKLISFHVAGVAPDGKANIARDNDEATFSFTTAKPIEEGCVIVVHVYPKRIETYFQSPVVCGTPIPLPRCSFAQVWEKARALGSQSVSARLSFDSNGWLFSATDLARSIDDDCP